MSDTCDFLLQANLTASCKNQSTKGLKNAAVIMNYDDVDWDSIEYDDSNPNLIRNFNLKSGHAYRAYVPGKTPYTGTNKALVVGNYKNKYTKQVKLVVLANGAEVCHKVIDQLSNGRFVVILENDFQGESRDNTFEFYGLETGLSATELTDDKYSEDTDGGWAVTLEETDALSSGKFFLLEGSDVIEAVKDTRSAIEGLLDAGTPIRPNH